MESMKNVHRGTMNIGEKVNYKIVKGSNGVCTDEEIPTPEGFTWWRAENHDPIFMKYRGKQTILAPQRPFMDIVEKFQFHPQDTVVCGFMKTGTSWVQEVVYQLIHEYEDPSAPNRQVLTQRCPTLESLEGGAIALSGMQGSRFFKTHFSHDALPRSFDEAKPKVIYIYRNPKDTCVSLYHFMLNLKPLRYEATFDQFFRSFCLGHVMGGEWWSNLSSFWQKQNDLNILFLSYEDMMADFPKEITRIANFLGKPLTEERICQLEATCSFDAMKENNSTNFSWWKQMGLWTNQVEFMRKGKVGDWTHHLSDEQSKEIDAMVEKYITPLGIQFKYELKE